jgi:hypothetical protein
LRAAAGIWLRGGLTQGGSNQPIGQLEYGLVRRVLNLGAHFYCAGHVGFGHAELLGFTVVIFSVRQETPDFFPGWRLMNSGLDAFVPATIQNSS